MLYFSPTTLRPYVYWCCSDYGQQYDDVTNILKICFGEDVLITSREEFRQVLENETKDTFKQPGKLISSFKKNVPGVQCDTTQVSILQKPKLKRNHKASMGSFQQKVFDIYKVKGDSEYFKEVNRRFQAIFQFYIDGASFIDFDPNWHYFVCYMDHKLVGYTSVLEEKRLVAGSKKNNFTSRVLLSQFIVLPPYQGLGLGSTLLRAVYDYYINQDKQCIEFSVEEPSDEFQSLMDLIEIKLIW